METYAGFWKRFVAFIIDAIIISCAQTFLVVPIMAAIGLNFFNAVQSGEAMDMSDADMAGMIAAFIASMSAFAALFYILTVLYFTLMEASKFQGTVGKMALGIKVTDMNGGQLDFGKALIRNLCKIISQIILYIGYIMAGFTEKKQGLHDIIAGTLVVNKNAPVATAA